MNVKEINFIEEQIRKTVKPNYRTMGKKFGKLMKAAAAAVAQLDAAAIAELEAGQTTIVVEGESFEITRDDVELLTEDMPGWSVVSDGPLTVALDITITPELRMEGQARDIVRSVQNLRKTSGLNITDRILLTLPEAAREAATVHKDYICGQVLAVELSFADIDAPELAKA